MAAPTMVKKSVEFVGVPTTIDREARLLPYSGEGYEGLLVRIRSVFDAYQASRKCGGPMDSAIRQQLDGELTDILQRLDTLSDQSHLTIQITKAVAARMGIKLYATYNVFCAGRYLDRAAPLEASISETSSSEEGVRPWWGDLKNNWSCFFSKSQSREQ